MENYEKKYKEALCWMRKIYPTMNGCDKEDAERHFPELKESEDERISNAIMCYITDYSDGCSMICVNGVTRNEAVAWLEKQGKQKPAWSEKDEKIDAIKDFDTEFEKQVSYLIASAINKEYEYNQGYVKWIANALLNYAKHELEKQDEQKPVDKPESKFHEGEWITNGDKTWKIVEVKPLDYMLQSQDGNIVDDTISYVDKVFHSFTIKDAKDGDVLADKYDNIGIFQEREGVYWNSYIYLGCDSKIRSFFFGGMHEQTDTHPATKEQRDLLFQAINESRFEWNAEKKKLKLKELKQ